MEKFDLDLPTPKSEGRASKFPQFLAAFIINLSGICNGIFLAWPAIVIPSLQSKDSPIGGRPLTDDEISLIASLACIAAAVSVPIFTIIRGKFGYKFTGYIIGIFYIINWTIIICTSSKLCIYIARIIAGSSAGGLFVLCPQYVSEIAQDKIRGTLGIFFAGMFTFGYLFTNGVGAIVSYTTLAIIGLILTFIFMASFYILPETPQYLLTKGNTTRANQAMQWLRGKDADISEEMRYLRATFKTENEVESMTIREMWSDKGTRRGLLITVVLCINCQMCGIFAILSYLVSIFMESGSTLSPNTAAVIVGALQMIGILIASFLVDRSGRRILLMISNIAMALSLIVLGTFFYLKHIQYDVTNIGWLPVTSLSIYVTALAIGLSPLVFVVLTEICLPSVIKFATTMGYCIIWTVSFITSQFFTSVSDLIGIYGCYWLFAMICILGAVFVYFVIPETKGMPVEDIYRKLCDGKKYEQVTKSKYNNDTAVVDT